MSIDVCRTTGSVLQNGNRHFVRLCDRRTVSVSRSVDRGCLTYWSGSPSAASFDWPNCRSVRSSARSTGRLVRRLSEDDQPVVRRSRGSVWSARHRCCVGRHRVGRLFPCHAGTSAGHLTHAGPHDIPPGRQSVHPHGRPPVHLTPTDHQHPDVTAGRC